MVLISTKKARQFHSLQATSAGGKCDHSNAATGGWDSASECLRVSTASLAPNESRVVKGHSEMRHHYEEDAKEQKEWKEKTIISRWHSFYVALTEIYLRAVNYKYSWEQGQNYVSQSSAQAQYRQIFQSLRLIQIWDHQLKHRGTWLQSSATGHFVLVICRWSVLAIFS
jgi:hypothetical protein